MFDYNRFQGSPSSFPNPAVGSAARPTAQPGQSPFSTGLSGASQYPYSSGFGYSSRLGAPASPVRSRDRASPVPTYTSSLPQSLTSGYVSGFSAPGAPASSTLKPNALPAAPTPSTVTRVASTPNTSALRNLIASDKPPAPGEAITPLKIEEGGQSSSDSGAAISAEPSKPSALSPATSSNTPNTATASPATGAQSALSPPAPAVSAFGTLGAAPSSVLFPQQQQPAAQPTSPFNLSYQSASLDALRQRYAQPTGSTLFKQEASPATSSQSLPTSSLFKTPEAPKLPSTTNTAAHERLREIQSEREQLYQRLSELDTKERQTIQELYSSHSTLPGANSLGGLDGSALPYAGALGGGLGAPAVPQPNPRFPLYRPLGGNPQVPPTTSGSIADARSRSVPARKEEAPLPTTAALDSSKWLSQYNTPKPDAYPRYPQEPFKPSYSSLLPTQSPFGSAPGAGLNSQALLSQKKF